MRSRQVGSWAAQPGSNLYFSEQISYGFRPWASRSLLVISRRLMNSRLSAFDLLECRIRPPTRTGTQADVYRARTSRKGVFMDSNVETRPRLRQENVSRAEAEHFPIRKMHGARYGVFPCGFPS